MADRTHETELSDSDEHFSDAQSNLGNSHTTSPVHPLNTVGSDHLGPTHDAVSETDTYNVQRDNAESHRIASKPERTKATQRKSSGESVSTIVAETEDTFGSPSEQAVSVAGQQQQVDDTVPDIVLTKESSASIDSSSADAETKSTKSQEEVECTEEPDLTEEAKDAPGSPNLRAAKSTVTRTRRASSGASRGMKKKSSEVEEDEGGVGEDFDDFEDGEENAEFDDFEDGFQEAEPPVQDQPIPDFSYPVLNFSALTSPNALFAATEPYLDTIFPPSSLPTSPPASTKTAPSSATTFLTSRSASLWSQLVAPPPLQPPNWIRSRIRRLFLISLGVPIDLDEILPASKQKKLVLPSTPMSPRTSVSLSRLKSASANTSSTSVDSQGNKSSSRGSRRKAPPPAPGLDLLSARQLCNVTDEARMGFTDEELRQHVKGLEWLKETSNEALEYWTKKTDETIGDREAFEGVIENLVKHARKIRK